eukprot:CAMPEP_0194514044 /NCGR_PEP_ID=MMETSP0253-20130528/46370_1 /TAXON_ID=2966 /ORGANISM="Noctiluca scintillans" /LENGTH=729 /DNA_ID=CAMNT_0039357649 /DNA_START=51 /DNA_END=2240 /DNA_ORIENTATION=+
MTLLNARGITPTPFEPASPKEYALPCQACNVQQEAREESPRIRMIVRCRPSREKVPGARLQLSAIGRGREEVALTVQFPASLGKEENVQETQATPTKVPRVFRCNAYLGPDASHEDVFSHAVPLVEQTLDGCSSTIFCCGATGAGKSYTLGGPAADVSIRRSSASWGIMQRTASLLFEVVKEREARGHAVSVEASYMQIFAGHRETLTDLLTADGSKLEVNQDPLNCETFVCEGLHRIPCKSTEDMCEAIYAGQRRAVQLETSRSHATPRSHAILTVYVEVSSGQGLAERQRGKLHIVDLASSDVLSGTKASSEVDVVKRHVDGMGRVLCTLNRHRGNVAQPESPLTKLCHAGSSARKLFIANICPDVACADETIKTLEVCEQLLPASGNLARIEQEQASLHQMRARHAEVLRILESKAAECCERETQERERVVDEVSKLSQGVLSQLSTEKSMEQMRLEQVEKIESMRAELAQTVRAEFDKMRLSTVQDLDVIKKTMEEHVIQIDEHQGSKSIDQYEVRLAKMNVDLETSDKARRSAEEEIAELRVRLASSQERTNMLHTRQDEFRKERTTFEDERKTLRLSQEQQWQKISGVESELQKFRAQTEMQRAELSRLAMARSEDAEAVRREREAWRMREAELQREVSETQRKLEDNRAETEMQMLRCETEQREACSQLRMQIGRLEVEAASRVEQLNKARQIQAKLEGARDSAQQREPELAHRGSFDHRQQ